MRASLYAAVRPARPLPTTATLTVLRVGMIEVEGRHRRSRREACEWGSLGMLYRDFRTRNLAARRGLGIVLPSPDTARRVLYQEIRPLEVRTIRYPQGAQFEDSVEGDQRVVP